MNNRNLILVLGGAKSGKTDFAVRMGEQTEGKKIYLATATTCDDEMAEKVKRHKQSRGSEWNTIEEPIDIEKTLLSLKGECSLVLLDCMTLWLSNIMERKSTEEEVIVSRVEKMLEAARSGKYTYIIVSNEVGMGIVPVNRLARLFRDISGKTNQMIAKQAQEVYFVTAGIPGKIK